MRKPESTKKTLTPRKPPPTPGAPPWKSMTPKTAMARSPSRAGTKPKLIGRPRGAACARVRARRAPAAE